jgi:hypothetical protein
MELFSFQGSRNASADCHQGDDCYRPILQTRVFRRGHKWGPGSARPHLMGRRLSQLSLPFTVSLLPADWRTKKLIRLGCKERPTAAFAACGGKLCAASLGPFGGGFRIAALHQICVTGPAPFPQAMCIRQIDAAFAANYLRRRRWCRLAGECYVESVPTAVDVSAVAEIVDLTLTRRKRFCDRYQARYFEHATVAQRSPRAVEAAHPLSVNMVVFVRQLAGDCTHVVDAERQTEELAVFAISTIDQVSAGTCGQSGQDQLFHFTDGRGAPRARALRHVLALAAVAARRNAIARTSPAS